MKSRFRIPPACDLIPLLCVLFILAVLYVFSLIIDGAINHG